MVYNHFNWNILKYDAIAPESPMPVALVQAESPGLQVHQKLLHQRGILVMLRKKHPTKMVSGGNSSAHMDANDTGDA